MSKELSTTDTTELSTTNAEITLDILLETGQDIGFVMPKNEAECDLWLKQAVNERAKYSVYIGLFLLWKIQNKQEYAQSMHVHTNDDIFADFGLLKADAYNCINIATMVTQLDDKQRKKIIGLGKSKLIQLAKIPVEELTTDLEENGRFDEIDTMSVRELKDSVRRQSKNNQEYDNEIDTLKHKVAELESRNKESNLSELAFDKRTNIAAISRIIEINLARIDNQITTLSQGVKKNDFFRLSQSEQDHIKISTINEIDAIYTQIYKLRVFAHNDFSPEVLKETHLTQAEALTIDEKVSRYREADKLKVVMSTPDLELVS